MSKASITTIILATILVGFGAWAVIGGGYNLAYGKEGSWDAYPRDTGLQTGGKKNSKSRKSIMKNTKKTRKQNNSKM